MTRKIFYTIAFILLLASPARANDLSSLMPKTVGSLKRTQLITGIEAQAEVDKLHGKALSAEASCIARYIHPGDEVKTRPAEVSVWISRVESEKEARRQTGLMVHKMYENQKSPFRDPRRIGHNNRAVYRFSGMGQIHLIWFSGNLVYWVSCGPGDQQQILDVFCK